ncbi:Tetratricopeptide TPR-1 [Nosema bombycis CQ1]|uniref:Tetratricopeptide TPR-1 n=1 Tax=Nosema bombycis (strain CQ1 / CVCC 102059) TaxID=578461 RepID=R0M0S5_NOSB1|nr:Tetratricopeptide TPR-1 [Nosema bombycis CQ1]|eukprot:EOB11629.1 Tetratricopeptide TPR-1 [Nosema bombycis CQ1]
MYWNRALILWILYIVVIIWRKFFTAARNENNDDFLKHFETGKELRKRRNYDEAKKSFWKALRKANGFLEFRDAYNEIGACYYGKSNYKTALTMFNISLDLKITNLTALKWRSMCLAKLGMFEKAYEDAFLYDVVIDESRPVVIEPPCFDFETTNASNLFTSEVLRLFFIENKTCVSNLRYSRFYSSFNKIIPQDVEDRSDLAWILISKSYGKLLEFFFGDQHIKTNRNFLKNTEQKIYFLMI